MVSEYHSLVPLVAGVVVVVGAALLLMLALVDGPGMKVVVVAVVEQNSKMFLVEPQVVLWAHWRRLFSLLYSMISPLPMLSPWAR